MYKNLREYLKEATIMVILLSLIRQLYYFTSFKVPIKYFLTFSEIWLVLINDMVILLMLGVILLAVYLDVKKRIGYTFAMKGIVQRTISEKVFLYGISIISITLPIYLILSEPNFENFVLGGIMLVVILLLVLIIFAKQSTFINHFFYLVLSFIVFLFVILIRIDIDSVKRGKYKGTIISTKDMCYVSTDSSYFIGKTEEYVFIYNVKDTSTDVIPTSTITNMKIKMK